MNKYQKALKWVKSIHDVIGQEEYYQDLGLRFGQGLHESIETIKELVDKETQYNHEYRGKKVKLLGIFQKSDVLPPSPMNSGHNGGTVSYPVAIVEHEDGSMGEVFPAELKRSK